MKQKVKFPSTGYEGLSGSERISPHILTSQKDNVQLHAPFPLPVVWSPGTKWIRGQVGPRAII